MATPSSAPSTEEKAEVTSEMTQPIIVDLGRQKSSKEQRDRNG